ncbi:hypothetical protein [Kitasatospora sp. NPDC059327]|uniref:hypothetical protein n=1 Tax=Kitasatospora sp. NPDC059327 TaxID=3346803 RepID=UPI003687D3EE
MQPLNDVRDVDTALDHIDWNDLHHAAPTLRHILRAIADNRRLLTDLVEGSRTTPRLFHRGEHHPVMSRLVLAEPDDRAWALRLHVFHGAERDLIPHTHKRPFGAHILAGGYLHAWQRRTDGQDAGPFTSHTLTPGIVALETPGSDYLLGDPLIHQTIMEAGTVTLFASGPDRQPTWWAATDMGGEVAQMKQDDIAGRDYSMTHAAHAAIATTLTDLGLIERTKP